MTRTPMHADPMHPAWRLVPVAVVALFIVVTIVAVYDFTANDHPDALVGVILAPLGALAWTWVYWQIRKEVP